MRRAVDGSAREDEFVDFAVDLAIDVIRLERIRYKLREKMQASPIMNEQRHSQFLDVKPRCVWRIWCDG